jgi:hypothetical protein
MQQLQLDLKFNWPLQEQIPLDLDDCLIPKGWTATSKIIDRSYLIGSSSSTGGFSLNTTIDVGQVVFRTKEPLNWAQRLLYRLLKLRVENVDN